MKKLCISLVLSILLIATTLGQTIGHSLKQAIDSPYGVVFYDNIKGYIKVAEDDSNTKFDLVGSLLITESDSSDGEVRGFVFMDSVYDLSLQIYVKQSNKKAFMVLSNSSGAVYSSLDIEYYTITDKRLFARTEANSKGKKIEILMEVNKPNN